MPPRIEQLVLGPFKNYLLIDHIVDGGMGAVYRARFLEETMAKIVTIKMIKEKFSADEEFKKLFMNEIRVTFPLIHPNIAQTYEYGEYEGKLFTVMEYVDGRNLKEYLVRLRALKFAFPVEVSVFIVAEVCKGLSYAHNMKDQLTGRPLNIIHRDISPQNIMLTFDGAVKIIDFGIAKADTNSEKTKTGVIKGKLSYLAPEYLTGEGLDFRYDQFATGIVLWEMLCGRQLFTGKTDMDKMAKIHACNIPRPSTINPRVPGELDRIVLKALSRNPDNRFEDMEQLNRALVRCLYASFPNFSPTDLGKFGPKLFAKEIEEDRAIFQMISKPGFMDSIIEKLSDKERAALRPMSTVSVEEREEKEEKVPSELPEIPLPACDSDKPRVALENKSENVEEDEGESSGLSLITLALAGLLLVGASVVGFMKFSKSEAPQKEALFAPESREAPAATPTSAPTVRATKGALKLSNLDLVAERFFINGELKDVNYFREISVPLDTDLIIRVERDNYGTYVERVKLSSEEPLLEIIIPKRQAMSFGYLITEDQCPSGKIYFNLFNEERVENLPIDLSGKRIAFPLKRDRQGYTAPTSYSVQVRIKGENARHEIKLNFESDFQKIDLCQLLGQES